jgi:hypothetical protein
MAQAYQQATENYAREVVRLLPGRLGEQIMAHVQDRTVIAIWKQFASNQLHDIVRDTLAEVTSPSRMHCISKG